MSNRVNVGIIGTGFVQDTFHMPAYSEIKLANVVAVAGIENTAKFAKRWNIHTVYHGDDAIEKLCKDPDVDVVDIGIPNNLHLQTIITAAENHKPVICEKPLGVMRLKLGKHLTQWKNTELRISMRKIKFSFRR